MPTEALCVHGVQPRPEGGARGAVWRRAEERPDNKNTQQDLRFILLAPQDGRLKVADKVLSFSYPENV